MSDNINPNAPETKISSKDIIKEKLIQEVFSAFDCSKKIKGVDLVVAHNDIESLIWASVNTNAKKNLSDSLVQLVLMIGKARTFEKKMPPEYLAAINADNILLVPFYKVQGVFYQNDFDWKVSLKESESKEITQLYTLIEQIVVSYSIADPTLKETIVKVKIESGKIQVTKDNFIFIYQDWLDCVATKKENKTDQPTQDVYLLDIANKYESYTESHKDFWRRYERPSETDIAEYIAPNRNILIPKNSREFKGAYFTPQIWVEKSQQYLGNILGENWQDEYYVWDCCAGSGNLLVGLTNRDHIFASTLDEADIQTMKSRAINDGTMLEDQIFQFDFLRDEIDRIPAKLREILQDEEKRKKLVIYINPPYAEAGNRKQLAGTGSAKTGLTNNRIAQECKEIIGQASHELYAQFIYRIYTEFRGVWLGNFCTTKILQSSNFNKFRAYYRAKLIKMFVVPADTFDNVHGKFSIGFFIWNTGEIGELKETKSDVFDEKGNDLVPKTYYAPTKPGVAVWASQFKDKNEDSLTLAYMTNDKSKLTAQQMSFMSLKPAAFRITRNNLVPASISYSILHSIPMTWLNSNDILSSPDGNRWAEDKELHSDCLAFMIFHMKNYVSTKDGTNHWIPFTEGELGVEGTFESHFMENFIRGKIEDDPILPGIGEVTLFSDGTIPIEFSEPAQAVFDAGKLLFRYYHEQLNVNINASLYDIRRFFQGTSITEDGKERMKSKSNDVRYMELLKDLRASLSILAGKITKKAYEYGYII